MSNCLREERRKNSAYAGLEFIKAAFCPLEFTATPLGVHPGFAQLRKDKALAVLEVSDALNYPRQFPYTDVHGHRRIGTQIITAAFGLAPKDFDLFLGLYTYLRRLPELPADGRTHLTVDFLARHLGLPATCQKDYLRIRSRIFRFSFVKYTNSAFWNPESKSNDIVNFGFFNIAALSRVTESRRPITFEWDPTFLRLVASSAYLAFDYHLYRTLHPAMRRLYLIANRDGWNQRESGIFLADDFAVHQIGYDDNPARAKLRRQKLRHLLRDAEELGIIRPCAGWHGYFRTATQGPYIGRTLLRWMRGPLLRRKGDASTTAATADIAGDALYDQVRNLRDEHGKPVTPKTYLRLLAEYGRAGMQKHVLVILAQKEHRPKSFRRSEVATYVDRLQNDYADPDWFASLKKAERIALFDQIKPNQLSLEMYDDFFRTEPLVGVAIPRSDRSRWVRRYPRWWVQRYPAHPGFWWVWRYLEFVVIGGCGDTCLRVPLASGSRCCSERAAAVTALTALYGQRPFADPAERPESC
jgi:hypothetical protein